MQYTIRGISPVVDDALRTRAQSNGKSLNQTALDALAEGLGVSGQPAKRRNLRNIITGKKLEKAVLDGLAAFDQIDEEMWR